MRLLNTSTLKLVDSSSIVPPLKYAILSHTWGKEEVTFDEIGTSAGKLKIGYQKIKDCCTRAKANGYQYVWIDTCCIDKKSSSELSEAINRMYSYYKDAGVCYAYLCDVLDDGDFPPSGFAKSRWFTRGWTLQELVAPKKVVFFDQKWTKIGTRASLKNHLEQITTIDRLVLEHPDAVFSASVAQRMSWASKRETTREEDIAYCLLGIFNVHMPLLYGEGDKAFIRLQLELLALSNEQTIFAWTPDISPTIDGELPIVPTLVRTNSSGERQDILNLLACSPAPFANCGDVRHYESTSLHLMTNVGLSITLPTLRVPESQPRLPFLQLIRPSNLHLAILNCYRENSDDKLICIPLWDDGNSQFHRLKRRLPPEHELLEPHHRNWARNINMFITPVHSHHSVSSSYQRTDGTSATMLLPRRPSTVPQRPPPAWKNTPIIRHWFLRTILSLGNALASSFVNMLLICIPLGILAAIYEWSSTTVFVLNYLAIVPLARFLSFTTKALSSKVEQLLGRDAGMLVDATFGNAVLVVSIIALSNGHIRIVQSTLLGSILSNILLVLGICFLAGGIRHHKQSFNSTSASTMSSLVAVTLASIIIPATLYAILHASTPDTGTHILFLSRGAAILLLLVYMVYLYFQLKFGANFLDIEQGPDSDEPEDNRARGFLDENPILAFLALLSVTLVMTINGIYFVESIEPVASSSHLSRLFIGFILIPMVGMAADPATAFNIAYHNKIDLAINIAIRRSVQIALFVTPFMVILGWAMNKEMTLHFQGFETVVFFLSLCEVSYLVQDGKSKHLASAICIGTYVIIALTFYVYPDDELDTQSPGFLKEIFVPHLK